MKSLTIEKKLIFFDLRLDFQKYWNILNVRCPEILRFGSNVAHVAQSVEHVLGKDEVTGSIPVVGSILINGNKKRYSDKETENKIA